MLHGLRGRRGHGRRHGAARGSLQALPLPHCGAGARSLGSGPGCPQLRKARSHLRWAGKGLNPWPQPQGLPRPRPRPPNTQAHPAVHGALTTEQRSARRYGHRSEPRAHRLRSPGRPGNPGRCPTQALGTGQRPLTLPQGPLPTPRDKELPAQSPKAESAPPAPPPPTWAPTWKLGGRILTPPQWAWRAGGLCTGDWLRSGCTPHPPIHGSPTQPRGLPGGPPQKACAPGPPARPPQRGGNTSARSPSPPAQAPWVGHCPVQASASIWALGAASPPEDSGPLAKAGMCGTAMPTVDPAGRVWRPLLRSGPPRGSQLTSSQSQVLALGPLPAPRVTWWPCTPSPRIRGPLPGCLPPSVPVAPQPRPHLPELTLGATPEARCLVPSLLPASHRLRRSENLLK